MSEYRKMEFYITPNGKVMVDEEGTEPTREYTQSDRNLSRYLLEIIAVQYPEALEALSGLYSQSKPNAPYYDYLRVHRFIRCNFGEHDLLTPDIERDILHFEEVRCPLRGICPDENIICKPQSLYRLTPAEKEVAKLYLRGDTFDMIARELGKSPSTVKQQLWKLKKKLGAKNCREIIRVLRIHNI